MADDIQAQIDAISRDSSLSQEQKFERIRQINQQRSSTAAYTAQTAILSGTKTYNDLTREQQIAFGNAATVRGAPFAEGSRYNPASVDSINESIRQMVQNQENAIKTPGWLKTALWPIETLGSSMYWVWSNTVSRWTSFGLLEAHSGIQAFSNLFGGDEDVLNYKENWKASKEFSPAQALIMAPMTQQQLLNRGIDIKNPKNKGYAAEDWFTHGWEKWTTGLLDASYSFVADPFVLAGKGAGLARRTAYVKPGNLASTDQAVQRQVRNLDTLFNQIDKVKATSTIDGEYSANLAFNRVRRFIPTVSQSAASDGLASALVKANTRQEQALVLRSAMGDTEAISKLSDLNEDVSRSIRVLSPRFRFMNESYATAPLEAQQSAWGLTLKAQLDDVKMQIQKADAQRGLYTQALDSARSVDALYFNKVTTPVGIGMRQRFFEANAAKTEYQGLRTATKVVYDNFNARIVRILRAPFDTTPSSWIKLRDADSWKSVQAAYRDLPKGFFGADDEAVRGAMVGEYIGASIADRPMVLKMQEDRVVQRMAERHGVSATSARQLWQWYDARRSGLAAAMAGGERFSAAKLEGSFTADVIDHTAAGGSIAVSPVLSSQIASSHVMMNFTEMNKLLKIAGPQIERLINADPSLMQSVFMGLGGTRAGLRGMRRTVGDAADLAGSMWKVAQLARLGYGPRAIGDEFAGQAAALGGIAMLSRMGGGLKAMGETALINLTRGKWQFDKRIAVDLDRSLNTARMQEFMSESARLDQEIREAGALARDPGATRFQRADAQRRIESMTSEKQWVDAQHADAREAVENATGFLRGFGQTGTGREGRVLSREKQGLQPVKVKEIQGSFAGSMRGETGPMYRSDLSGRSTFAMQLGVDADRAMRHIQGDGWTTINASAGERQHMSAWLRDLNMQIRNDPLARQVLLGKSDEELVSWLRGAEGRAYRDGHAMGKQMSAPELAERVKTHVDHYLDPNIAGAKELRAQLAVRDVTGNELKNLYPTLSSRPDVNSEMLSYAMGKGNAARVVSGLLDGFYKYMNALPAEILSRNPVFNQLYRSHINEIASGILVKRVNEKVVHLSPQEFDQIENAARRLALRDTKRLTFTMEYEDRLTHAVRFIYPFMGAQRESWARWARITANDPQTIAHAGNLYNMPMRMQVTTDSQGNPVSPDGYATNVETGERYRVNKTDIMLNVVIPKPLRSSFQKLVGLNATELRIPLNSFNLVAPDKVWFLPSAGPVVQIPANKLVTSGFLGIPQQFDKADLFADLGILPYGPRDSWTDFINPATGRRLGDSQDEYSANFQKAMFEIAQEEAWKAQNGNRPYNPDWAEVKARARQYTTFKTFINFISPVTVDTANPYDFWRDAYKRMVKEDPKNGEQAFRDKYGDSLWMFSQTLTKNNGGLPASDSAVRSSIMFKQLQDSLQDPSLLKLIAGPYASGSFSPGAYYYQLNTPVQTGSDIMQREKLTAREAMDKAKTDQGWYEYNKVMTSLQQQLFQRGLRSYEDHGAEDLLQKKQALVSLFGMQKLPNGQDNPYYNPQWRKDYDTVDRGAYDRRINDMWTIVNNPVMQAMAAEGSRTDIKTLTDYLLTREEVEKELKRRDRAGGSADITAKKNADLRDAFQRVTNMLIEKDTRFGELHNRYLSSDMGYDVHSGNEVG